MAKMNSRWCGFGRLWNDRRVQQTRRRLLFRTVVVAPMLDQMVTLCATLAQTLSVERAVAHKLRCIIYGDAAHRTNEWTRRACVVPTKESALQIRRLCVYRSILLMIGDVSTADSRLPALWLGRSMISEQLVDGVPHARSIPWLRLFHKDV